MSDNQLTEMPDYTKYTLADLCDVRKRVDADQYPVRVAAIEREIQIRLNKQQQEGPPDAEMDSIEKYWLPRISKQAIGGYLVIAGMLTLARIVDIKATVQEMPLVVGYLIPFAFYGVMVVAGAFLLWRKRIGLNLAILILFLQIPMIRIGRLLFSMTAIPTMELKLWPDIGFAYTTGHTTRFLWADSPLSFYLGLNLTACAMVGWLSYYHDRQQLARERLRIRRVKAAG